MGLLLCNRRGQGLIESVLALPVIFLSLFALSFLCYRGVIFYCADHYLHEALLCTNEAAALTCSSEYEQRLAKIMMHKKWGHLSVRKSGSQSRGQVEVNFPLIAKNFGPPLVIEKKVSFHLKSSF